MISRPVGRPTMHKCAQGDRPVDRSKKATAAEEVGQLPGRLTVVS